MENLILCTHPFLLEGGGRGVEPPIKSSKGQRLEKTSTFRGGCWERGNCNFHIKDTLKSEIFDNKKG